MKLGSADDYLPHLEKWVKGTEMLSDKKAANVLLAFLYSRERAQGQEDAGRGGQPKDPKERHRK